MTHQKLPAPFAIPAFQKVRGAIADSTLLVAAIIAVACSGRTDPEAVFEMPSLDSNSHTASDDGATAVAQDHDGGPYVACIGNNDFSSGSCAEDQICGSMPNVGYTYCMPRVPCASGMVPVLNVACAYPCADPSNCFDHGLAKCAVNTLADLTDGPAGWCTP